jgi:hypothetical protein
VVGGDRGERGHTGSAAGEVRQRHLERGVVIAAGTHGGDEGLVGVDDDFGITDGFGDRDGTSGVGKGFDVAAMDEVAEHGVGERGRPGRRGR